MPRQARATGEYMHIIVRGNGKQILFEDTTDREKYLYLLKKYAEETEISILAYCLMENHVHLLIQDPDRKCSVFMKKIDLSYARYYNGKYERIGHLFQDRYRSEIVTNDVYLLSAFRYILNNPEKAGICRAESYPWSSYREYNTEKGLSDPAILRKMIGGEAQFRAFMRQQDDVEHLDTQTRRRDDEWALGVIKKTLNIASGTQLQQFRKEQRDNALALLKEKGLTVRQLERLTGINRGVIQKAKAVSVNGDGSC